MRGVVIMKEEREKLFVIKDSDNFYWKKDYPFWVHNINNVSPLPEEDAQIKAEELELSSDKIIRVLPLSSELEWYRNKYYK
jgi:hypothetical protein